MFHMLILGLALLVAVMAALRWYAGADTAALVQHLKRAGIGLGIGAVLFMVLTGRIAWMFAFLPLLVPLALRWRSVLQQAKVFRRMASAAAGGSGARPGQRSEVETRFLRMRLDHANGELSGEVKEGTLAGRDIGSLSLEQLLDLLQLCRAEDDESARLLEAYLDRARTGDWRTRYQEKNQGSRDRRPGFSSDAMDRAEAARILGVAATASTAEIKAAYHRLIAAVHPDHGGSDYLAAKINRAKDVLLGG
ncbi:DnaJ domain-containing protein [Magnetospira thiophila]